MINNNPEFNITTSRASPSWEATGQRIKEGKNKVRLILGEDPRFNILGKKLKGDEVNTLKPGDYVEKGFWKKRYVVVEAREGKAKQNVLLSVLSLARRLHLQEKDIIAHAKAGTLGQLILPQIPKVQRAVNEAELSSQLKDAALTKRVSDKIFQGETVGVQAGSEKFIATVVKGELKLDKLGKELGQGGFAHVYATEGNEAVKIPAASQKAVKDLKNEQQVLAAIIPKDKTVLGLQSPLHTVTVINSQDQRVGYWNKGEKYAGSYDKMMEKNQNLEAVLTEFHQLLHGLKYLAEKNVLHGDIKPQNVLCKETPEGLSLHIADFGEAKIVSEITVKLLNEFFTSPYTSEKDRQKATFYQQKLDEAIRAQDGVEAAKFKGKLIELLHKMDVFGMGCVLFNRLTNQPFPYGLKDNYPNIKEPLLKLENPHFQIPDKLAQLIKKMLDPNPANRPAPKAAFDDLKAILDDYPNLRNKLVAKEG